MRMRLAAGIVVLACAALPGAAQAQSPCGGFLQRPCPAPTPTPTPEPTPTPTPEPTPAPEPAPLKASRYAALEPVMAAAVPAFSPKATRAQERRYLRLCRDLPTDDALLRDYRRHCLAEVASASAFECSGSACVGALRRGITRLTTEIARARALGRTATREVEDRACRNVLRVPANDIAFLGVLRTYARELSRAKSRRALDRAETRFDRASRRLDPPRSPAARLTALRARCAPPA